MVIGESKEEFMEELRRALDEMAQTLALAEELAELGAQLENLLFATEEWPEAGSVSLSPWPTFAVLSRSRSPPGTGRHPDNQLVFGIYRGNRERRGNGRLSRH
jgi:hypothetical protein